MLINREDDINFVLHDEPLDCSERAYFHFDEFAAGISRLIASKNTRTPLTIGISGQWGSGKTTLMKRIRYLLDQTNSLQSADRPSQISFADNEDNPQKLFRVCRTVWFNAWKYNSDDELLVALIRSVIQEMLHDDFVTKIMAKLLDPSYPRRDVVATVLNWLKIKSPVFEIGLGLEKSEPTVFSQKTALIDLFDDAFNKLMAAWIHHQWDIERIDPEKGVLVIFIDDLDRCMPEKTLRILEAIKLFLNRKGCIFILGADDSLIRQTISETAKLSIKEAKHYLEKIIQLNFELPTILGSELIDFAKEVGVPEEFLSSWDIIIESADIEFNNIRKLKIYLNDLMFRWFMLKHSNLDQGADLSDFVYWQRLIRAAPRNFIEKLNSFRDINIRFNYVIDANKWGQGNRDLDRFFMEYLDATFVDFRNVLGKVSFTANFTPLVLDSFVRLVLPGQVLEALK